MTDNDRRTYVLDTSVFIADPSAIFKFAEHDVVVPAVVVKELEGLKTHRSKGVFARRSLHHLENLRREHGTIREPVPLGDGRGTIHVELNHRHECLPTALRDGSEDARILTVAKNLQDDDGLGVVLVSKDLALRLNADLAGVAAEEYRNEQTTDAGWTGMVDHPDADPAVIDRLYSDGAVPLADVDGLDLPVNAFARLSCGSQSVIARLHADKELRPVNQRAMVSNLTARSSEQHAAIDLLRDDDVKIVSIGGHAGSGKSVLSIGAALDLVQRNDTPYRRVVLVKPAIEVTLGRNSRDLGTVGYLKGDLDEKLAPHRKSVDDALEALGFDNQQKRDQVYANHLDFEHFGHIRGRTLRNTIVICSEVQSLERNAIVALLSRIGEGSRIILEGDVSQRDNPFVGRFDGIASVVAKLKGHHLFGHVTLQRVERSEVAELVAATLDDGM